MMYDRTEEELINIGNYLDELLHKCDAKSDCWCLRCRDLWPVVKAITATLQKGEIPREVFYATHKERGKGVGTNEENIWS